MDLFKIGKEFGRFEWEFMDTCHVIRNFLLPILTKEQKDEFEKILDNKEMILDENIKEIANLMGDE